MPLLPLQESAFFNFPTLLLCPDGMMPDAPALDYLVRSHAAPECRSYGLTARRQEGKQGWEPSSVRNCIFPSRRVEARTVISVQLVSVLVTSGPCRRPWQRRGTVADEQGRSNAAPTERHPRHVIIELGSPGNSCEAKIPSASGSVNDKKEKESAGDGAQKQASHVHARPPSRPPLVARGECDSRRGTARSKCASYHITPYARAVLTPMAK